jgi:hypothetical protein
MDLNRSFTPKPGALKSGHCICLPGWHIYDLAHQHVVKV